jgi:hypothetical protein
MTRLQADLIAYGESHPRDQGEETELHPFLLATWVQTFHDPED